MSTLVEVGSSCSGARRGQSCHSRMLLRRRRWQEQSSWVVGRKERPVCVVLVMLSFQSVMKGVSRTY